jgi:ribosome-binding factor A
MERVNEQIKRAISQIMQEHLNDPRLAFVSIVRVEVSKDLRNGKVFFSVLGSESQVKSAQLALQKAAHLIRRELGRRIEMRFTPELLFKYDSSIQDSVKLEERIKEIHDEHR